MYCGGNGGSVGPCGGSSWKGSGAVSTVGRGILAGAHSCGFRMDLVST